MPSVTAVSVAGGINFPGSLADDEVMLDIEVLGALAPAADIVVYFAPNTDQGFYEAISQAAHDGARHNSVMSISWGGPEDGWTASARTAMESALEDAATLGVTVTVACGDLDLPFVIARGRELANWLPKSRFHIFEGMAHLPYLEQPAVVAELITSSIR